MNHMIPSWNDFEKVKAIHAFFERWALIFFAVLVLFEVLAHWHTKRENLFKILALISFGLAVAFEICAYPYSRRVENFAEQQFETISNQVHEATALKPLPERIREFLNEIDPTILIRLKTNYVSVQTSLPQSKVEKLWDLYSENGAQEFLGIWNDPVLMGGSEKGIMVSVDFNVFTNLLDGSKRKPPF